MARRGMGWWRRITKAQGRWRFDRGQRQRQHLGDQAGIGDQLLALRAGRQVLLECREVCGIEGAQGISAGEVGELLVRAHGVPSVPRVDRSFWRAVRIRVFTVPSGSPSRSAMAD